MNFLFNLINFSYFMEKWEILSLTIVMARELNARIKHFVQFALSLKHWEKSKENFFSMVTRCISNGNVKGKMSYFFTVCVLILYNRNFLCQSQIPCDTA